MVKRILLALCIFSIVPCMISSAASGADTIIKGTTSDATAASLEVTNSSDATLLYVRNDGNVGVGINAPTKKLHVSGGDVRVDNMTTAGFVKNDANGILSGGNSVGSFVGGSDTQVQFNDAGTFGGAAGLTYNKTTTTTTIDALNLTNALALLYGGTGATTQAGAANSILPAQTGNTGKFLGTDGTNVAWNTVTSSPGGADTQVQFNDGGALAGNAGFAFNKTTQIATISTLNLTNPLGTAYGGTGATTPAAARSNLSAAASGANSDITSITGLTTPLAVDQGGTAATTAAAARTSLGAAASGANSDITSITGLTTPLALLYGGTGATTQSGAANNILPSQTGNNGKFLKTDGTNVSFATVTASPGGADTQVQFNDGGTLSGATGIIYNKTTSSTTINTLGLTNDLAVADGGTGTSTGSITGTGALTFAAGGTNQNVTLTPSGTGDVVLNSAVRIGGSGTPLTAILAGTVSVDPPSLGNNATTTFTVTITGAATTDMVFLTPPSSLENLLYQGASVTSANTVTIKMANESGGTINGSARTWSYLIIKP